MRQARTRGTFPPSPAHILYYLGGLVAIGAMTLFMTLGRERFGHGGLLAITLGYALIGLCATEGLLRGKLRIPAGITAAFTLVIVPLAEAGCKNSSQFCAIN